ncbi:MAG TPA: hypothetical protein VGF79_13875 [Bacteroidia bacterium]
MRKENITLEDLRSCPEFEGMSEEMAQKMLSSLNMFCDILSAKCLDEFTGKEW